MKLATLRDGSPDGVLHVVSRDLTRSVTATGIAATLQTAIEQWEHAAPSLQALYDALNDGKAPGTVAFDTHRLAAPPGSGSTHPPSTRTATCSRRCSASTRLRKSVRYR